MARAARTGAQCVPCCRTKLECTALYAYLYIAYEQIHRLGSESSSAAPALHPQLQAAPRFPFPTVWEDGGGGYVALRASLLFFGGPKCAAPQDERRRRQNRTARLSRYNVSPRQAPCWELALQLHMQPIVNSRRRGSSREANRVIPFGP